MSGIEDGWDDLPTSLQPGDRVLGPGGEIYQIGPDGVLVPAAEGAPIENFGAPPGGFVELDDPPGFGGPGFTPEPSSGMPGFFVFVFIVALIGIVVSMVINVANGRPLTYQSRRSRYKSRPSMFDDDDSAFGRNFFHDDPNDPFD